MSAAKHLAGPRFVYFKQHRWAHCYCARAASWTFRNLYGRLYGVPYEAPDTQTLEELLRLQVSGVFVSWFVREPIARFLSVYRRFAALEQRFVEHGIVYPMSIEMRRANTDGKLFSSLDVFTNRALNDFVYDKHIAPQADACGDIPNLMAPLEHPKAWPLVRAARPTLPAVLPRDNRAVGISAEPAEDTLRNLRKFYAADIALHDRLWRELDGTEVRAARSAAGDS